MLCSQVSEELTEAFRAAQDGSKRYLVVRIEAEVLKLTGSHDTSESQEEDFATILGNVPEHEPSFVLFRRDLADDSEDRAWTLVSYVTSRVVWESVQQASSVTCCLLYTSPSPRDRG